MAQVSVVMPVYNHANYVREAIESVQSQTLEGVELIVVNDGSTDALDAVLQHVSPRSLRIVHARHAGLPAALNLGFRQVRGEFVTWTSADNVMLPTCLERLHAVLKAHPRVGAAYADYVQMDEAGVPLGVRSKGVYRKERLMNFGPAFLMRTAIANQAGEFDLRLAGVEDRDHALRVATIAPVYWLPEVLYLYRVHDDSLSGRIRQTRHGWQHLFRRLRRKWRRKLAHHRRAGAAPAKRTKPSSPMPASRRVRRAGPLGRHACCRLKYRQ